MKDEDKSKAELLAEVQRLRASLSANEQATLERQQKLHQQNEYLSALHETALGMINRLEVHSLLEDIVTRAARLVDTEHGYVILPVDEDLIEVKVGLGVYARQVGYQLRPGEGFVGHVWREQRTMVENSYATWEGRLSDWSAVRAIAGVPLRSESGVVGVIGLVHIDDRTFGEKEIYLLSRFAALASICLDNARLYENVSRALAERIEAEKALAQSEEKYRLLVENANEGITVTQDGRFKFVNPKVLEVSGYTFDDLTSTPLADVIHPEDRKATSRSRPPLPDGGPRQSEFRIVCKNGEAKWVLCNTVEIRWEDRPATLDILSDITERKLAEQVLRQAHDVLEQRVRERTAELERSTARLEQEVRERRQAEEELKRTEQRYNGAIAGDDEPDSWQGIIGKSKVMKQLYQVIEKVAQSDAPVIIYGESGTGKELCARAIHQLGPRSDGPYIQLNCAALNENVLESELFGHIKGAFTGAYRDRIGRFEAADGGDLFLDEIGDVPPNIQVKLLRVLETKQFERMGDHEPVTVNVRIISATNRDLEELIAEKRFREDFFFRINVIPIRIPPLRDRLDDIPVLTDHFIRRLRGRTGKTITGVSPQVMARFMAYRWPGNVRELLGALEYAFVVAERGLIYPDQLPQLINSAPPRSQPPPAAAARPEAPDSPAREPAQKRELIAALEQAEGNQSRAARILGVNRMTIANRIKKYGVDLSRYRV